MKKVWTAIILGTLLIFGGHIACFSLVGWVDDVEEVDVMVVLGNKVEEDGVVSPRLKARLDKAVELYHQNYAPKILVSGGLGKEGFEEGEVMKDYLLQNDVPDTAILVDKQGNNTFLTAKHTAEIMAKKKWQSVLIISQFYHINRCRLACKRFGIPTIHHSAADFVEWRDVYSLCREIAAYYYYYFRKDY